MPHSRESAWPSSAVLIVVESPLAVDPAHASKLATAALQRASSNGDPSLRAKRSLARGGKRRRCCRQRPIRLRDGTGTLGKSSRFRRLTPPERGLFVYGMEIPSSRDSCIRTPSGAVGGGLSCALKVRKPADAVLNTAAWQGDAAPPLEPPASRAAGGAADGRGTPRPEPRRRCARA